MKKMAFVSRHAPTPKQIELARLADAELDHVGDMDGFTGDLSPIIAVYHAVACVHAALAVRCITAGIPVVIFNNVNRAEMGQPPKFETTELHIYAPSVWEGVEVNHVVIMEV